MEMTITKMREQMIEMLNENEYMSKKGNLCTCADDLELIEVDTNLKQALAPVLCGIVNNNTFAPGKYAEAKDRIINEIMLYDAEYYDTYARIAAETAW